MQTVVIWTALQEQQDSDSARFWWRRILFWRRMVYAPEENQVCTKTEDAWLPRELFMISIHVSITGSVKMGRGSICTLHSVCSVHSLEAVSDLQEGLENDLSINRFYWCTLGWILATQQTFLMDNKYSPTFYITAHSAVHSSCNSSGHEHLNHSEKLGQTWINLSQLK